MLNEWDGGWRESMFVLTRACCEQKAGICLCGQVLRAAGLLLPIHPTEVFILEYVRTNDMRYVMASCGRRRPERHASPSGRN